ncbi:MAG: phenylalanine--tRNA ligase subunit alpha [Alphaproteobacteria bacterium]|nr:phenylalanine--tRNA ligase subunit alpha [Alphaproteobacteria bacterium]
MSTEQLLLSLKSFTKTSEISIRQASSTRELEELRHQIFGKQSALTDAAKVLKNADTEIRKIIGQELNKHKRMLEDLFSQTLREIRDQEFHTSLLNDQPDISLSPQIPSLGAIHPTTETIQRISSIFAHMGFQLFDGPEVEKSIINFDALNIPPFHPARSMQDTFYLNENTVLRTHTSNTQIRTMREKKPPLKILSPGRVFRSDSDATHAPMFHQIEGLVIDKRISFSHLIWTLKTFLSLFFNNSALRFRIRPSYFPFTQPSAEVDIAFEDGSFLEVLGCGMVHRSVLQETGIDPHLYQGFAFGLGVERLTMLKANITDLRPFFDANQNWISSFNQL